MSDPLRRLLEFHRLSRELAAARTLLGGVPDEMRALHEEFSAGRAELDALDAAALEAKRKRIAAEGAVSDAQERLRKFQQQVSRVRNQREYGTLLHEIDSAKSDVKRYEEETLVALEAAETTARELEERRAAFADLESRHAAGLAAWEARKPEVARRADELAAETESLRSGLPKPIVAQYERIAVRYAGEALSWLRRQQGPGSASFWFCSTCNYQIRPQVAVEIRTRGTIVQCEGCKRFLQAEDGE
jgi:predicted  nucleic acid-binding Zn-ribbon protein